MAVQRASLATRAVLTSVQKGDWAEKDEGAGPVTVADFAAQALLISGVRGAFPADNQFVGEEDADALRANADLCRRVWELVRDTRLDDAEAEALLGRPQSMTEMLEVIDLGGRGRGGARGRIWMTDPVDGTATFLRGQQYAVSLALVVDGREAVGALGCPNLRPDGEPDGRVRESAVDKDGLGLLLSAARGQGAAVRRMASGALQPARPVSLGPGPRDLRDVHVVDSAQSKAWWHEKVEELAGRLGAGYPGTDLWSSHMRYVALILGGADVQLRIPRKRPAPAYVWDHAGIQLIFTESGGTITDLNGEEIDFGAGRQLANNYGIIAARSGVHSRVLSIVREMLGDHR